MGKLAGGLGAVNSNVMGALRGWLTTEAKALLEKVPKQERATSILIQNVAAILTDGGRLAEAEALYQQRLAAWRANGEERHPNMLIALSDLATNLYTQRKYAEAEPLFREAMEADRELLGNDHVDTQCDVANLGEVLMEQGKLDEAEPLCVEAVAWIRARNRARGHLRTPGDHLVIWVGSLVELRRRQGRLAEAEAELGSLVADARAGLGPQHQYTLRAEAIAARLKHTQPGGAAAGASELRYVVDWMGVYLGAAHQETVKWRGVLDEMGINASPLR